MVSLQEIDSLRTTDSNHRNLDVIVEQFRTEEVKAVKEGLLRKSSITAYNIAQLRPGNGSYSQSFVLMNDIPIFVPARRLPETPNGIVGKGIKVMINAVIIKPAHSSMAFLMVLAQ